MKITFTHFLPIKQTMRFEKLFHPNLRLNLQEKKDMLRQQWTSVWMLVDGRLAGETYGMRLDEIPEDELEEVPGCERYRGRNALYVCSTAILRDFQGLGLSRILKAYFLGCASSFPFVLGHAFEGASLHLVKSFGARIGRAYPDWSGTGQTVYLYEMK
jgi:hypothetical protein